MLEPVVGSNNVVARVAADLDFRQVRISEESFDPDSSVVRSEQRETEHSTEGSRLPGGSPDLEYQPFENQNEDTALENTETYQKENSVINYEINRVNRQIVGAAGVIDGPYTTTQDEDGETIKEFTPRSRREMKAFEEIVRRAIGFDENRGDQITVSNIPFAMQREELAMAGAGQTPSWLDYLKKASRPAINLLLVAMFFFLAVRPFRRWLKQTSQQQAALPRGRETPQLEPGAAKQEEEMDDRSRLIELTKKNPEMAADIIRGWLSEGSR
jgi:flagellar M-ring protein FliF